MPFVCKIRDLHSAERDVEKIGKIDSSLRDGLFVGYRFHPSGKWTGQYQVIDSEAFSQVHQNTGRCAYVHAVSEIYVPGSAGDDQEAHPTVPVAEGLVKEALASEDESSEEFVSKVEDLHTEIEETLMNSERSNNYNHLDNAGGDDIGAEDGAVASDEAVSNRDSWIIDGDFLVRRHKLPRTTLFSPLDCLEDPPPILLESIEVLRTTKPEFSGTPWPDMEAVEECWMGRAHNAKPLTNPLSGETRRPW